MFIRLLIAGLCIAATGVASAAEQVSIVVGPDAPFLERFAADELARQLTEVFSDVEPSVATSPAANANHVILIGSPESNALVKAAVGDQWPTLSDQGLVIRTVNGAPQATLVVGGGSPIATLWAVYELGHRNGIRYLLRGDILPNEKRPLDLAGHDLVMEPELRVRTWRTVNCFAVGPESWGLADHEKLLAQLAKMKFNDVMVSVWPWHPFLSYEFDGVQKQTALLWFGEEYPLDGETAGKKAFGGLKKFENPDFAGLSTPEEMMSAGVTHVRGIIDAAHRFGMTAGICISPLEFPREFQAVLPGSRVAKSVQDLTVIPGAEQGPQDETLLRLVETQLGALRDTYPEIDSLYLTMPEFPEWDQHADTAWDLFAPRLKERGVTINSLIASARGRGLIASGDRGERALRGNLVALAFLDQLAARDRTRNDPLLSRRSGAPFDLVIADVDSALFPVLDAVLPSNAVAMNFVDYTARRVVANRELLRTVPADKVRSRLIMTLADDNVGILPQSSLQSLGTLTNDLQELKWEGFSTRYWLTAELDPTVYYLSRASWQRDVRPKDVFIELFATITGKPSAADRLWLAFEHLEAATNLIDEHDLGFTFPVPGLMLKHSTDAPVPEWWTEAVEHYTEYSNELYRAHGASNPPARKLLFYYAKRSEYVLDYLAAVQAVREAAIAKAAGDQDKSLEQLEAAITATYNCINTLADVAHDQSDRGLIAVLNAYAYRPLLAEFEKQSEAE
ncbi:MAG: hypothetical protein JNG89_06165 [Planctomycetaceae bacterium]|nr:hypothetical protein [Planctomycetaceae bacterium]